MSKIQYKHIDLDGSTLVQRRHKRQILPPGMVAVTNMYPSRSDGVPTLRADLEMSDNLVYAVSDIAVLQDSGDVPDIVNSATGIYGTEDLLYLTSYIPWGSVDGAPTMAMSSFSTGTATAASGSSTVAFAGMGGAVDLDQKTWRGAMLEIDGDGNYYVVDKVIAADGAGAGTVQLVAPTVAAYSGDTYELFYNHNCYRAAFNKIEIQQNGAFMIYGTPAIDSQISAEDISGPFYGGIEESDWKYGGSLRLQTDTEYLVTGWTVHSGNVYKATFTAGTGEVYIDGIEGNLQESGPSACVAEYDWNWTTPYLYLYAPDDPDEIYKSPGVVALNGIDNGADNTEQYTLATNGSKWLKIIYSPGTRTEDYWVTSTAGINADNTWTKVDVLAAFYGTPTSVVRDSTLGIVVSDAQASADSDGETDSNYISWNDDTSLPIANWTNRQIEDVGDDPLYPSPYAVQSVVSDGTTMTAVMWNSADDAIKLVYADAPTYGPWADCTGDNSFTGSEGTKIKLVDGNFVVCSGLGKIYTSSDGKAFTELDVHADVGTMDNIMDIAYNGNDGGSKSFVLVSRTGHIANCATVGGTYVDRTPTWPSNYPTNELNFVFYDPLGHTFMIPTAYWLVTSGAGGSYGETWNIELLSSYGMGHSWDPTNCDYSGTNIATFYDTGGGNENAAITWLVFNRSYVSTFEVSDFQPVSETYRANTVSVLDGYTVLFGIREFAAGEWTYKPRGVVWSVAGSPVDFTGTGSGTGEFRGSGGMLRSIPVNGRIVVFETVAVGALVPRGDTDDPWDYDIIDDKFSFLSNPVAANGTCYIVGTDGLLYSTDGIGPMTELGASFDLTEFDDFDDSKPVWLVYSAEYDALLCYYRDTSSTTHMVQVISISTGGVSEFEIPHLSDGDDLLSEVPGSIVATEGSSLARTYVSYGPDSETTDSCQLANLFNGRKITGEDSINSNLAVPAVAKFYATFETGELYITQEGEKSSVKHLIIESYTEAGVGANTDTPYIVAEVKSIEDSGYATGGDTVGTATMTTTALTGSGTAWSTTIAGPSAGSTVQECDGAEKTFTLPCLGSQARVYLDTTLQTAYTSSGKTITFTTAPAATKTLYAYWENYPEVKVKVGDFFKSTEGWHRVTAISSAQDITLDHYLSTGSETVVHHPAWQMDDGHGRVELGINRLVEGVQIRLYMIPDYDGTDQSTVAKITGLSIGYVPQGRKIVKATGS